MSHPVTVVTGISHVPYYRTEDEQKTLQQHESTIQQALRGFKPMDVRSIHLGRFKNLEGSK